jgi:hypothetical protein
VDDFTTLNQNSSIAQTTSDIKAKIKQEFSDLYRNDKILIDRTDLTLGECIGRGNYGNVYKGILNLAGIEVEEVAVKRLGDCKFIFSIILVKLISWTSNKSESDFARKLFLND